MRILSAALISDRVLKVMKSNPSYAPGDTRFLIFGLNQNIIGDGSVAELTFKVNLNAPAGPYSLFLSGIVGSDAIGDPVVITNLNPASIPEPSTLLLIGSGIVGLLFSRKRTC